ncbi:ADP-ribosylation factor-binding protein GGA2 isoform X1 [Helicoverpa armigera]|uniref:ADP-ribosylation factor-binding protein GGA2 isoform X1 n=1 Tax=Helicoverpa armigera TaxID=29058 RepID=UPI0030837C35
MNVTLISLEALILKATHESLPCPDAAALEAFCAVMRDSAEGPQLAAQALAARIHTPNTREALLALSMLDRCMRRCDAGFHAEVGKFRFLNEMIKLVSPKYFADRTSPEVRTRVLQLLHAWSIEYPKETKFKVAYDMLKNQGVVKETPPPLPPEDVVPPRSRAKNAIFEDEEKSKLLQKLLQSKKPEDLQHANRLIKTMVREEERRNEESSRRAQEVGNALDSAELLRELLANAEDASPEEEQLIHELHVSCGALRLALQRLAASETQPDSLSEWTDDILHASEVLDDVFEKYDAYSKFKKDKKKKTTSQASSTDQAETSNSDSLLDFAGNVGKGDDSTVKSLASKNTAIDELGDIFSTGSDSNIVEPLKPVSLMPSEDVDLLGEKTNKAEGWNELDSLGEQLIKQSLPDHVKRRENFNSKTARKIPMNALASPKHDLTPATNGALFDLDFFTKKPEETKPTELPKLTNKPSSPPDDVIVDITDGPSTSNVNTNATDSPIDNILDLSITLDEAKCKNTSPTESVESNSLEEKREKTKSEVKPLTDIDVSLSNVTPSNVPPMTIFEEENGLTVVLHFCKDKPRPDVNVIVISTTNKNKKPILDFRFQGVVPKCCKVRLLTPSGTSLPQYNPFLPPPALTQVMLIARPASRPRVDLRFVISYTCDDDACSEIGDVSDLPLDHV